MVLKIRIEYRRASHCKGTWRAPRSKLDRDGSKDVSNYEVWPYRSSSWHQQRYQKQRRERDRQFCKVFQILLLARKALRFLFFQQRGRHLCWKNLDEWLKLLKLTIFGENSNNWSILIDMLDGVFNLKETAIWIESSSSSIVFVWLEFEK